MTLDQVAEHLLCSPNKVRRMETGFRSGTVRDVRDLCDLYGVTDEAQREHMMGLARESKQRGWWESHDLQGDSKIAHWSQMATTSNCHPGRSDTAPAALLSELIPRHISKLQGDGLLFSRMMIVTTQKSV